SFGSSSVNELRVGDPMQPGSQSRSSLKRGQFFPGRREGLLGQILGLMNIARQVEQKKIHLLIMAADQLGAGLRTSRAKVVYEAFIVRLGHAFSTGLKAIAAAVS